MTAPRNMNHIPAPSIIALRNGTCAAERAGRPARAGACRGRKITRCGMAIGKAFAIRNSGDFSCVFDHWWGWLDLATSHAPTSGASVGTR